MRGRNEILKTTSDEKKAMVGYLMGLPTHIKDVTRSIEKYDGESGRRIVRARRAAAHYLLFSEEIESRTRNCRSRIGYNIHGVIDKPVVYRLEEMQDMGGALKEIANEFTTISLTCTPVLKKLHNKFLKLMMEVE